MKYLIQKIFNQFSYKIVKNEISKESPSLNLEGYENIINKIKPFTMTSPERIVALLDSVKYVVENNLEGDIVECGVWKGGSMMSVAEMLVSYNNYTKNLFLFDTYEGMSSPSENDISIDDETARDLLNQSNKTQEDIIWCYSPIEVVKQNMSLTNYPSEKIHFIKGKVEETLPYKNIKKIALLRLDTDWYESTKHELETLFPLLISGGVLIIDDYGHWKGARKAVDEYFEQNGIKILLNRIDYTGRIAIKQ